MENIFSAALQEILFASSDPNVSKQLSKLEKAGKVRKIAPRVYSSNLTDKPAVIVRRNLLLILGKLYPGSMLSHRSAFEFQPTASGNIFLTYSYSKKISLPGVTLRFLNGRDPIDGDHPVSGELYVSQRERALLENLQTSRQSGGKSKTLPLSAIEEKLEQIIKVHGEDELNRLRDRAKAIAGKLKMKREFAKLNKIISALLQTHPSKILTSPVAAACAFGAPYDPERIRLFERLFVELRQREFKNRPDRNLTSRSFRSFAFFESYFSNFIEGTVFALKDAQKIIETGMPLPARDEDSHDILGTFQLAANKTEMKRTPQNAEQLLKMLQYRHRILLSARKTKHPGQFKERNNRAGETWFVDFKLVRGTLMKGFDFYRALPAPFAQAAYMMFMVSEVHPFEDGNGRIARIMMNAELVKAGQSKIIIPTVYRDDYMGALRKLTRQHRPDAYIRMLQYAHEFSESITGNESDKLARYLEDCNAFKEPEEGKLKISREGNY